MAFDGITVANIVKELQDSLTGGRISKIVQPESDELLLTIKTNTGQKRLFISADASLPLIYLTGSNKQAPLTAPGFCMLLRKHLQNGRIICIRQPGLERIVELHIEHLDELGDFCMKKLIIEIMGKHSNIIFTNQEDMIIDSIKHVSGMVSSLREVLPGRPYFVPNTQDKLDLLTFPIDNLWALLSARPMPIFRALYGSFTGLSPLCAQELCHRAGIDGDLPTASLTEDTIGKLSCVLTDFITMIKEQQFYPNIIYQNGIPAEFASFPLSLYHGDSVKTYDSISLLLEGYYAEKNAITRIRQKSADLRKIVQTALERNIKKYDLQLSQIKDTEKREKYRIYGELITAYGYSVEEGAKSMNALNYYTNEEVTIPLDPCLSPIDNAKKYFARYNKMKRTYEALSELTLQVHDEIRHLESISTSLDIALGEEDLVQIREELMENGYIRRRAGGKKQKITSRPFHYLSSDGYHIYVGKNNYQNENLTFRFASGNDWWFHAKGIPGSHVIVKSQGEELPDRTFEEAAKLAAYYSKARGQDKVEIDYIEKKHVKKPGGGKPGFVVYYTNYSMMMDSDISGLTQLEE